MDSKLADEAKSGEEPEVLENQEEAEAIKNIETEERPGIVAQISHGRVHVVRDLNDLVTKIFTAPVELQEQALRQRALEHVVHRLLMVGLVTSAALMLTGLGLDLFLHRDVPTAVPDVREVFRRVAVLRPSGFLALGLLALIATPILRVATSVVIFIFERDWRYTFITFLVLMIVVTSVILGSG
ncbi:MAG TPA: DUF1634 domain-containing protein [Anaerolineales bacterium]|jgi:uncharacterized membrane protein|nr:DUF1634 domain-containing protein [Anaerolineales bacterium]